MTGQRKFSWWRGLDEADRAFIRTILTWAVACLFVIVVMTVNRWVSEPRVVRIDVPKPGPTVTVTATPVPAPVTTTPTPKPSSARK